MRAVIQRVDEARVVVGKDTEAIGKGFLVLVAATHTDTSADARYLAGKIAKLRIMADQAGKMNRTLKESGGAVLVVSQFTLYARTRKGNRPSFVDAASPEQARKCYDELIERLKQEKLSVSTGHFGEYMKVQLINDGPVTIIIDSRDKESPRR